MVKSYLTLHELISYQKSFRKIYYKRNSNKQWKSYDSGSETHARNQHLL